MEPYRSAGFRCPTCPESPLREFQNRLICDECQGLLLGKDDYLASCADMCPGKELSLEVNNVKPATSKTGAPVNCPRCERQLATCDVTVKPLKVRIELLACSRDGLWFPGGQLSGAFALVSRKGGGYPKGPYYGQSDRVGLDGIPMSRHGSAAGGLAISDWNNRPRKRAKTASPINLFSDKRLACPACTTTELRFFGDRYQCEQCAGTFVQNEAFESMVMDISKDAWTMPPATGSSGTRACPVCTTAMLVEDLERVQIDRCVQHGLWFDPPELTVALENASHQFDPRGIRAWLKKLF